MRPALRRLLRTLLAALLLPLVLVAVLLLVANTDSGRRLVARAVGEATGGQVVLTDLGGTLPFGPRIGRLELRDGEGVWLAVEGAELDLDPWRLLRGELAVEALTARSLVVARLPAGEGRGAGWPIRLPLRLQLERLAIEDLQLDGVVPGVPRLAVEAGGVAGGGDDLRGTLLITAPGRSDRYRLEAEAADGRLRLVLAIQETPGGLLAALAGSAGVQLPAGLADWRLDTRADGPFDALALNAKLDAGPLQAAADGTIDLEARFAKGLRLSADLPAMALTPEGRPPMAWERIALKADLSGPLLAPQGKIQLEANGLAYGDWGLDRLTLGAEGDPAGLRLEWGAAWVAWPVGAPGVGGDHARADRGGAGPGGPGPPGQREPPSSARRANGQGRTNRQGRAGQCEPPGPGGPERAGRGGPGWQCPLGAERRGGRSASGGCDRGAGADSGAGTDCRAARSDDPVGARYRGRRRRLADLPGSHRWGAPQGRGPGTGGSGVAGPGLDAGPDRASPHWPRAGPAGSRPRASLRHPQGARSDGRPGCPGRFLQRGHRPARWAHRRAAERPAGGALRVPGPQGRLGRTAGDRRPAGRTLAGRGLEPGHRGKPLGQRRRIRDPPAPPWDDPPTGGGVAEGRPARGPRAAAARRLGIGWAPDRQPGPGPSARPGRGPGRRTGPARGRRHPDPGPRCQGLRAPGGRPDPGDLASDRARRPARSPEI